MRARVLLWLCLGLNILLAMMIVLLSRDSTRTSAHPSSVVQAKGASKPPRTHVVVRRQGFTWGEIESADFATYIKNLRGIGCPERTIRDIIVAEVNELFADRLTREIVLPEQKWWLSDPDMDALEAATDQVHALDLEKTQLLTQLLGQGWNAQRSVAAAGAAIRFDGPVLSKLSTEARGTVERIEANSRRLRNNLQQQAGLEGRAISPQELGRLRQETRRELAAVLNPEQMEEYLLRYSQSADEMREQLRGFGADADEFRRIFRVRDEYDQQLAALSGSDAASTRRRAELERLRDAALRQAIGPERFALYRASENPLFREAQEQVEQSGAPPEKVLPMFRVNQAAQEEIARIQADRTLTEDQRRIALVTAQQQQRNSIDRILGNQPADEPAEVQPAAETQPQATPVFPPFPGAFGQPSRVALPPGADLPPGVNERTRGPVRPRRR